MKSIRVINADFELLGEIDNYESMYFTRCWHEIGEIEIVINRYKRHTDILQRGNIIVIGSDLHKVFIIKHREIELTEDGKLSENWVIKGLELKSIIGQRITIPPVSKAYDIISSNAETVMRHYVDSNIISSVDPNRNVSQLRLATNQSRGIEVEWSSRYKNLDEDITDLSMYSGLGWNVSLDISQKKWVFDVSEGRDLTAGQSVLPPVIFSPQFDSLQSLQYLESELNYKNSGYVAGQGEGELRRIVEIGTDTGLQRNELFIDARDVEEVDDNKVPIPIETINSTLVERGHQKLSEHAQEIYLEGEILTKSPFQYEIDYDLGDIITMQEKGWGVTTNTRITKIKEIYETDGFRIEAVFGKDQQTIVDKIKEVVDKPLVEKNTDVYSTSEVDVKIAAKSDVGHNHNQIYAPIMKQVFNGSANDLINPGSYSLAPEVTDQPTASWGVIYVSFISHQLWMQQLWIGQYGEVGSRYSIDGGGSRAWSPWKRHLHDSLDTPWTQLTFVNGWANYGQWNNGQYKRDANGRVWLRGLIKSGSGTIANLPVGFRPLGPLVFGVISVETIGRIDVSPNGNIDFIMGANAYITLDGISFTAGA